MTIQTIYNGDKIKMMRRCMIKEVEKYFLTGIIHTDLLTSLTTLINELRKEELKKILLKELKENNNIKLIYNILYYLSLNEFK